MYYLLGGSGYHNFGDELIVKFWLEFLTKSTNLKIAVDGACKSRLEAAFISKYPGVIFTDLVNSLSRHGEAPQFWSEVVRGATFFEPGGFENYPIAKHEVERLMNASVIHLHGGEYLNYHFPRKGFLLGLSVAIARTTGAKLIGTGPGVTPLNLPSEADCIALGDWLDVFHLIETRDHESAELLKTISPSARVVSGLDDTFLYPLRFL